MITLSEKIQAVRDYIAEHGWNQGYYWADDGRGACIRGAAISALSAFGEFSSGEVREFLTEQIRQMGLGWKWIQNPCGDWAVVDPEMYLSGNFLSREPVALYNDEVLKSKEEALAFLDKARIAAEEMA